MDKTMVSLQIPESKIMSKQCLKKGHPGAIKARVHASCNKIMVLAIFDLKGLIYSIIVPYDTGVNSAYIIKALQVFLKCLRVKRPRMAEQGFKLHWDDASVHTSVAI